MHAYVVNMCTYIYIYTCTRILRADEFCRTRRRLPQRQKPQRPRFARTNSKLYEIQCDSLFFYYERVNVNDQTDNKVNMTENAMEAESHPTLLTLYYVFQMHKHPSNGKYFFFVFVFFLLFF
jgi:hypothetical protein